MKNYLLKLAALLALLPLSAAGDTASNLKEQNVPAVVTPGNVYSLKAYNADPSGATPVEGVSITTAQLKALLGATVTIGGVGDGSPTSGTNDPVGMTESDTYFDTDNGIPYIYTGSTWQAFPSGGGPAETVTVGGVGDGSPTSGTNDPAGMAEGDTYFDTDNSVSYVYTGSAWQAYFDAAGGGSATVTIGGGGDGSPTSGTNDPVGMAEGDTYFDTDNSVVYTYTGSAWQAHFDASGAGGDFESDGSVPMAGTFDLAGNTIDGASLINGATGSELKLTADGGHLRLQMDAGRQLQILDSLGAVVSRYYESGGMLLDGTLTAETVTINGSAGASYDPDTWVSSYDATSKGEIHKFFQGEMFPEITMSASIVNQVDTVFRQTGRYVAFPYSATTSDGMTYAVFQEGDGHVEGGETMLISSPDGGRSWSQPVVIVPAATYTSGPSAFGVGTNDRLILVTNHLGGTDQAPTFHEQRFYTSDDRGLTWDLRQTMDDVADPGLAGRDITPGTNSWRAWGGIPRLPNGTLILSMYGYGAVNNHQWVMQSTDNGVTWTDTAGAVPNQAGGEEGEGALFAYSQTEWGLIVRDAKSSKTFGLWQYYTNDAGATWVSVGEVFAGRSDGNQVAPSVRIMDGVATLWWGDRATDQMVYSEGAIVDVWDDPTAWGAAIEFQPTDSAFFADSSYGTPIYMHHRNTPSGLLYYDQDDIVDVPELRFARFDPPVVAPVALAAEIRAPDGEEPRTFTPLQISEMISDIAGVDLLVGTEHLLAYWAMDETGSPATLADEMGSYPANVTGLTGTTGAAANTGTAIQASAASQSATTAATLAAAPWTTRGMTLGGWIKPTSASHTAWALSQFGATTADRHWDLRWNNNDSKFYARLHGSTVTLDVVSDNTTGVGTWAHVVFRVSSTGVMKLYINGVLQADTDQFSDTPNANVEAFRIGAANTSTGRGAFDEMFFFQRELTANEIAALYNAAAGTNFASLTTPEALSTFASMGIEDLGDAATPSVLIAAEANNTLITNYQTTGADHVFQLPAASSTGNVTFTIGDEFQMTLTPATGEAFYLNGSPMAVDESILNSADTLGDTITGVCANINGSFVWMFRTSDANWVQETP